MTTYESELHTWKRYDGCLILLSKRALIPTETSPSGSPIGDSEDRVQKTIQVNISQMARLKAPPEISDMFYHETFRHLKKL